MISNPADIHLNFSKTHKVDYEESTLTIVKQFSFCTGCMEESVHKSDCTDAKLGKDAFVTTSILMHNPPKLAGCPMLDSDCSACQTTKLPSVSYNTVRICEKDFFIGSQINNVITAD